MHAKLYSATTIGINAALVEVEVDLAFGLTNFCIVGLPDKAIKESKDRIRSAIKNSGLSMPDWLITVNLAPAHLKKQDVLFDVPIALAILCASGAIEGVGVTQFIQESLFLGELALDGTIRSVRGVLSVVDYARSIGKKRVILPAENRYEASLIKDIDIIGVESLLQLVSYVRGEITLEPEPCRFEQLRATVQTERGADFRQVRGQWVAKRALTIAAAGNHNVLFIGPPGSGKTMLAQRFSSIIPPLSFEEVIEVTKIYSIAGLLNHKELILERPFRSPHHTISQAGLVGGGSLPRPGEVSLSHHGVLFLDELTEFRRSTLEVLRQPLESEKVLISRAQQSLEFPASFMLLAALNPCPCGFFGDSRKPCRCSAKQITAYRAKLSGPLLDRIDLQIGVQAVAYEELSEAKQESSAQLLERVVAAREMQKKRGQSRLNGFLTGENVEEYCVLNPEAEPIVKELFTIVGVSMRGYHKILKIARTIADIAGSELIEAVHMQEALTYRTLDTSSE